MKRKTLLLACSFIMIVAVITTVVLTGCTATTVTNTSTKTATTTVGTTITTNATTTIPGTTVTAPPTTTTITSSGPAVTSTVVVTSTATITQVTQPILSDVLNPDLSPSYVARLALTTPRPASLAGKKIYVVGDGWGGVDGGDRVLKDILTPYLQSLYPTSTVIFRYKAGSYMTDDPTLWKEIASQVPNAVCIVGISG